MSVYSSLHMCDYEEEYYMQKKKLPIPMATVTN